MPLKKLQQLLTAYFHTMFGKNNLADDAVIYTWKNRISSFFSSNKKSKRSTAANKNKILVSQKIDPRPQELQILPVDLKVQNDFFYHRSTILYYEAVDEPCVKAVIQEKFTFIRDSLASKEIDFIFPHLLQQTPLASYQEMLHYYFPGMDMAASSSKLILENLADPGTLRDLIGFEDLGRPCFIRAIPIESLGKCIYRVYYLPNKDIKMIEDSIEFYLLSVPAPPRSPMVQYSVGNRNMEDDPDVTFNIDNDIISRELRTAIMNELKKDPSKGMLRMMLFLLHQMREVEAPIAPALQQFIHTLHQDTILAPSRLKITANGDILLIDFNKKINLTPLQKTVFIFFLLKQEGIYFKDLPKYKTDLLHIYSKITNRGSMDMIEKSVAELSNPYSNSMSEKCSRIKEAFLKCMDDRIARHYYVSGDRNAPKRISLDRSLVIFEDALY